MDTMHRHRRAQAGFTIVELMTVVAIVAIVMAIAIPSYKSVMTQNRMAGEINDVASDMELARSAAVKQGLPVTACAAATPTTTPKCDGTDWSTGWIIYTDIADDQSYSASSGDTLLRIHAGLQGGDTLAGSDAAGAITSLTFNRMGGIDHAGTVAATSATVSTLTLHDPSNTVAWRQCLSIAAAGHATLATQGTCP